MDPPLVARYQKLVATNNVAFLEHVVAEPSKQRQSPECQQGAPMPEHKSLENEIIWIPVDQRQSRFGGPMSPRKKETRRPVFWLARVGMELYFVNSSGETLDYVTAETSGFVGASSISSEQGYDYRNVRANHAVKVDEYDGFYDLDFVLQVSVTIKSPTYGCIELITGPEKGEIVEIVLLWDSGEAGKHVQTRTTTSDLADTTLPR